MVSTFLSVFTSLVILVIGLFPSIDVSSFVSSPLSESLITGLQWLNWLIPLNDMLAFFSVYAASVLAINAALFVYKIVLSKKG